MVQKDEKKPMVAIVLLEDGKLSGTVKQIHSEHMETQFFGHSRFTNTTGSRAVYCGVKGDINADIDYYWDGNKFYKRKP